MDDSNSHHYAWIPVVTNSISIEKGFETILEKYKKESSDNTYISKNPHIERDIKTKEGRKFNIKIILDEDKKVKTVQFLIPNSNKIVCSGDINFFRNSHNTLTGLIEIYNPWIDEEYVKECIKNIEEDENIKRLEKENIIKIDEEYIKNSFEKKKIREIYVCVRDIYHKHTHHDYSHDLLLDVVDASDTKDAIEKIIKQYEDKANKHILRIKDIYQNFKNKKSLSETGWYDKFVLATGEMMYAQRFIELHEDKLLEGEEYLISQFKHGEKALNTLKEMINEEIESQRKEEILKLTFISMMIGVIGAIIGIILSVDALHNLGVSWLITLIIMLVISILIVLTLGILLIKPIESRILKLLEKI